MATVFLGLGTNLGDRAENIREALDLLSGYEDIRLIRESFLYETVPIGYTDQPDFLNAVAEIQTDLPPAELLDITLGIEKEIGRARNLRWGPRVIDIDILIYDHVTVDTPELIIPHPRMMERAFVLVPLAEIAPDLELPDGRKPGEAAKSLKGQRVRRWRNASV